MSNCKTEFVCACGKKRLELNLTNWNRHLSFCKVAKLKNKKICMNVSSFFHSEREIKLQKSEDSVTNKKSMYKCIIIIILVILNVFALCHYSTILKTQMIIFKYLT